MQRETGSRAPGRRPSEGSLIHRPFVPARVWPEGDFAGDRSRCVQRELTFLSGLRGLRRQIRVMNRCVLRERQRSSLAASKRATSSSMFTGLIMICFDVIFIYIFFILFGVQSTAGICRPLFLIGFRTFSVVSLRTFSISLSLCPRSPSASDDCSDHVTISSFITAPYVAETAGNSASLS